MYNLVNHVYVVRVQSLKTNETTLKLIIILFSCSYLQHHVYLIKKYLQDHSLAIFTHSATEDVLTTKITSTHNQFVLKSIQTNIL